MATGVSILRPLGYQKNNRCGYCKNDSGSCSYYLSCDNMRVDHYQELIDRGWRRSGNTYYKPDLPRSCCPHYTIRLDAAAFKPRKEQRQAVNRWNNHVVGNEYVRKAAMLCPQSREDKRNKRATFDLFDRVHLAEYQNVKRPISKKTNKPIEPAHTFEVTLEADSCTKEKHKLYVKYQTTIHKDTPSMCKETSFRRFLCSGLDRKILKINGKTLKLGSYHQCYRLDGKLIAVGVLDLLPHAVSSVYLFYDPDYQDWDFGKLSALREIALAIEGKYELYYMGFYIHSCIKMRYKGTFHPSYLLDPESLTWNLFDDSYRRRLDQTPYVSLSRDKHINNAGVMNIPNQKEVTSKKIETTEGTTKPSNVPGENLNEEWELDSEPSDVDEMDIPEGSLFDYNIPGVLTKDQVSALDLDHWKLLVRSSFIELEDLRGWEGSQIDDPSTIKGIAAELIASTGPKLLDNSVLSLF